MLSIVTLFCGGGLGATCRHYFSLHLMKWFSLQSFWAILIVNLIGCLLIGIISEPLTRLGSPYWKNLLVTGFLGGFTTYSTFMLDFVNLSNKAQYATAAFHLGIHLIGGVICCLAGLSLSRLFLKL